MFIFLVLIVGIVKTCTTQSNTGTAIFYNNQIGSDCWTKEELAKLRARKIFNQIIPERILPDEINVTFLKNALRYYRRTLREVDKQHNPLGTTVLRDALADTIGGHLRSDVLPAARLAYYAGYVPYKPVRELHDLYDTIKLNLNTAGQGWKKPSKIPQIANITVVKITIGPGKLFNPCKRLIIKRDSNACLQLPIPRVDDAKEPTAVALPFKNGGLVSLVSSSSDNALLKYYTTAARCILRRSPASCRHSDIVNFNNDLWSWMKNEVSPHLMDENLYAAYGGVLRIAAAVQNYGRVLSRRNLFEHHKGTDLPWGSWRLLTQPYLFIDMNETPYFYIALVVLAAVAICFLQMCYNYVFGNDNSCSCGGRQSQTIFSQRNERQYQVCSSSNQIKYLPKSPVKTERVYDCNENLLDVVMSDAKDDCGSSDCHSKYTTENEHNKPEASPVVRSTSPPKIETSIEQLKIDKGRVRLQMREKPLWTEASSSGSESPSTGSSTSRPRDLAWARCVVDSTLTPRSRPRSRSSLHIDIDSCTTASRR